MDNWRASSRLLKFCNGIGNHYSRYHFSGRDRWSIHRSCYSSVASTVLQRNPSFSSINSDDISYFKKILGNSSVVQDEIALESANTDWMQKYRGYSKLMLQPRTTEEVSQILKYCNAKRLAVVPQGGNTGLVGGSVPVFYGVIINVGSMTRILSFDKVVGVLVWEDGCILENLIAFLDSEGMRQTMIVPCSNKLCLRNPAIFP